VLQACDADSVVSALTHAFYLNLTRNAASLRGTAHGIVPIVSCSRADYVLRREADWLLSEISSNIASGTDEYREHLTFVDDVTAQLGQLRTMAEDGRLSITLTDHNKMDGMLVGQGLDDAVSEIVDHHADSGAHARVTGAARHISFDAAVGRGAGSTCTLVAERLLDLSLPLHWDAAFGRTLLGVILLDTANLDPAAGKTTQQDIDVAARLEASINAAGGAGTPVERMCVTVPGIVYLINST
jgi:exopolyphosphatase